MSRGVDVILGSHPHVVQPISKVLQYANYKGNDTYVAYSLGNFLTGQRWRYSDSGIVAYVHINKRGLKTTVTGISYLPVYVQKSPEEGTTYRILPDNKVLGPRFGARFPQVRAALAALDPAKVAADQRMLEEALAAQKAESRRRLDAWLEQHARPGAPARSGPLRFSAADLDWLLQVLNDIRVGSWLRLGSPDDPESISLTKHNWRDFVALQFCGLLQSVVLNTLEGSG